MDMSISARAERSAKKQNKVLANKYPLLAGQINVSVESQIERLEKQEQNNVIYFERIRAAEIRLMNAAQEYKTIARQFLSADDFECYEYRCLRIYGRWQMDDAGAALADWWWRALRDNDVSWCWDHCPNEIFHNEDWHRRKGICITCHKPLEPIVETSIHQLSLIGIQSW